MPGPFFSESQLEASGLTRTRLFEELSRSPVGLVDIGARWGVSEVFSPASRLLDVLAFEPDPDEAEKLEHGAGRSQSWAGLKVESRAVADARRKLTLYLLARANNSSIYPVSEHYYRRYMLKGFELVKTLELDAVPLDEVVFDHRHVNRRYGEILKIDAQGAELDILRGAERTLQERTQCIVCEAAFFTPYTGACLFSDVERFLRDRGFSFYAFLDFQHRSTKRLDKRIHRARERFMQADAVFFRDPLETAERGSATVRAARVLFFAAMVLGFLDFCLELSDAADFATDEQSLLETAIKHLASMNAEKCILSARTLCEGAQRDTAVSLVEVGKFVDEQRDYHTYQDVPQSVKR